ncbi:CHAT domain-containing protein [Streptomyces acidiscabies]|uniref:CHAT domain-containing protein n=1 Tax=Streptomyces acidiscabies TaxID=42234 RepID=UPI00073E4275|nr:CHAT domain-containing protein [Streptomyces acidiscabies]GAQ58371.1 CHAT domain protein [Streptomyces acidiscabies]GAV44196.1 CHAT domain protein [Streptomyces acidiscabies]
MTVDMAVETVRDPAHGYTGEPPGQGDGELRVILTYRSAEQLLIVVKGQEGWFRADLETPATVLWQLGARLRALWSDLVVHHQSPDGSYGEQVGGYPLTETVDLSKFAPVTDELVARLAREGYGLLTKLLQGHNPRLTGVRNFLMAALARPEPLRVTFDSEVQLPWPMLAVDPGECGTPWEAFLGHRHQVEQNDRHPWDHAPLAVRDRAATSLNKDTALDGVGRAPEVHQLLENRTRLTVRTKGSELLDALAVRILAEDLMYFWCHGHFADNGASGTCLSVRLTDDEHVDGPAVEFRRFGIPRTSQARFKPFVLLNACHTGRAGAPGALKHLGQELIEMGAVGVLAPQIDVPQVFAAEYAYEFLESYLAGERTAGEISQSLVRDFAEKYHNPLALTYGLNCGIDSRLDLAS